MECLPPFSGGAGGFFGYDLVRTVEPLGAPNPDPLGLPDMALMVTDCYWPDEQQVFRDGMRKIDEAMKKAHNVSFMQATPVQRIAVLTVLDRE